MVKWKQPQKTNYLIFKRESGLSFVSILSFYNPNFRERQFSIVSLCLNLFRESLDNNPMFFGADLLF
jgi:hypothetical protein